MPFTFSHPAAILPLRRAGWPTAALAAGSMAPDAPYFLHVPIPQYATHSLPGIVTIDLAMAAVAVVAWHAWLAPAAFDLAPDAVRARLSRAPQTWRGLRREFGWRAVLLACAVGGLTHVAWDAFTHPNRWGVRQISWLSEMHGSLPGFAWAQYASGLVGGAILALAGITWWRGAAPGAAEPRAALQALPPALPSGQRSAWLAAIISAGLLGSTAGAVAALQHSTAGLGFHAATWGGTAAGIVAGAATVWLARRRAALPSPLVPNDAPTGAPHTTGSRNASGRRGVI